MFICLSLAFRLRRSRNCPTEGGRMLTCLPDEHHLRAEVDRANHHIMPGPAMAIHCP